MVEWYVSSVRVRGCRRCLDCFLQCDSIAVNSHGDCEESATSFLFSKRFNGSVANEVDKSVEPHYAVIPQRLKS